MNTEQSIVFFNARFLNENIFKLKRPNLVGHDELDKLYVLYVYTI